VAAAEPASVMRRLKETFEYLVYSCLHDVAYGVSEGDMTAEAGEQADLVREILGNPLKPTPFEPAWRTDTVLALARRIYRTEDFTAMPILADALQDAGCDTPEILNHCREPGHTHVRGCWVLDHILGRE
jgi:hypothetical protein